MKIINAERTALYAPFKVVKDSGAGPRAAGEAINLIPWRALHRLQNDCSPTNAKLESDVEDT